MASLKRTASDDRNFYNRVKHENTHNSTRSSCGSVEFNKTAVSSCTILCTMSVLYENHARAGDINSLTACTIAGSRNVCSRFFEKLDYTIHILPRLSQQ